MGDSTVRRILEGQGRACEAGLRDEEAALVLWGQGLGVGGNLAKLPGF